MQPQTKILMYGSASAVLLFIIGGAVTYLFIPRYVPVTVAPETETLPVTVPIVAERVAPEGYTKVTWPHETVIALPTPQTVGVVAVESALQSRRSRREFADTPVSLDTFGQMLWAGQGITNDTGGRTAPSSRNGYPTRLFVVVDRVDVLTPGLYEYLPESHSIGLIRQVASMNETWEDISPQPHPQNAAFTMMVSATIPNPDMKKPVLQESGHVAQNFYLQAEALMLAMTVMGGYDAQKAQKFIGIDEFEEVLYLVPVGNRAVVGE